MEFNHYPISYPVGVLICFVQSPPLSLYSHHIPPRWGCDMFPQFPYGNRNSTGRRRGWSQWTGPCFYLNENNNIFWMLCGGGSVLLWRFLLPMFWIPVSPPRHPHETYRSQLSSSFTQKGEAVWDTQRELSHEMAHRKKSAALKIFPIALAVTQIFKLDQWWLLCLTFLLIGNKCWVVAHR